MLYTISIWKRDTNLIQLFYVGTPCTLFTENKNSEIVGKWKLNRQLNVPTTMKTPANSVKNVRTTFSRGNLRSYNLGGLFHQRSLKGPGPPVEESEYSHLGTCQNTKRTFLQKLRLKIREYFLARQQRRRKNAKNGTPQAEPATLTPYENNVGIYYSSAVFHM